MGLNTITISFKNKNEDIELMEWINNHSNKSGFIKDILKQYMNDEKGKIYNKTELNESKVVQDATKKPLVDLSDF